MKSTIKYGSEGARAHVGHVTERDQEVQVRLPIDKNRDRLEWVCVYLTDPVNAQNG